MHMYMYCIHQISIEEYFFHLDYFLKFTIFVPAKQCLDVNVEMILIQKTNQKHIGKIIDKKYKEMKG